MIATEYGSYILTKVEEDRLSNYFEEYVRMYAEYPAGTYLLGIVEDMDPVVYIYGTLENNTVPIDDVLMMKVHYSDHYEETRNNNYLPVRVSTSNFKPMILKDIRDITGRYHG